MSMLNIGTTALLTNQTALTTTSHNISNVNTEGYNRQRVEQGTRIPNFEGGYYIGSGVQVDTVTRMYDEFLADQVRIFTSQQQQFETFTTFSRQVDDLLGSPELSLTAGLEGFFDAVQAVADDPTSIPARQVMLTEADTLTTRFNTLDRQLDAFNEQVNLNLQTNVKDVNTLAEGIARLNQVIIEATNSSQNTPNDLLDQRDQLINELAALTSVETVEQSNGAVNVFIGTGQSLVVGGSYVGINAVVDPLDPTRYFIGYGNNNIDITRQMTGGSIGGLLSVRDQIIEPARAEIDALATGLAQTFNDQHKVGITLSGTSGGNFFLPVDGSGVVTADASSIRIGISDPRDIAVAFPVSVRTSANNLGTASLDVTQIDGSAVGFDAVTTLADTLTMTYDSANSQYVLTYGAGNTAVLAYDASSDSGKTFDLSALVPPFPGNQPPISIKLSGVPANADTFTLTNSAAGGFTAVGDNRNALALGELQTAKTLTALDPTTNLPVGGAPTRSFGDAYGILVANVATRTNQAEVGQETQQGLLDQTKLRFESISGVNLDEEAASLIKYQQTYQAASQIITVSNTVFNALIEAV